MQAASAMKGKSLTHSLTYLQLVMKAYPCLLTCLLAWFLRLAECRRITHIDIEEINIKIAYLAVKLLLHY